MTNNPLLLSSVLFFALGACATDDPESTNLARASRTDEKAPCSSEKLTLNSWSEVLSCEKSNPAIYEASLQGALKLGAKCTDQQKDGCHAVSPDDPVFTLKPDIPFVWCSKPIGAADGRQYIECCFLNDGYPEVCDWAWIRSSGPVDPTQ